MPAELWTDQLQECDSDDDAESIEVAEQKCVPLTTTSIYISASQNATSARSVSA